MSSFRNFLSSIFVTENDKLSEKLKKARDNFDYAKVHKDFSEDSEEFILKALRELQEVYSALDELAKKNKLNERSVQIKIMADKIFKAITDFKNYGEGTELFPESKDPKINRVNEKYNELTQQIPKIFQPTKKFDQLMISYRVSVAKKCLALAKKHSERYVHVHIGMDLPPEIRKPFEKNYEEAVRLLKKGLEYIEKRVPPEKAKAIQKNLIKAGNRLERYHARFKLEESRQLSPKVEQVVRSEFKQAVVKKK